MIILEEGFTLILEENFKKLFGFSNGIINESYTRLDLVPQVDIVKYLKIYSNIVDNTNDDQFLSNVFINGDVSNLITFNESNIYRKEKFYENTFNFLEINIKDQNNRDIEMKDFFQISAYISKKYIMLRLEKLFKHIESQLQEEKNKKLKICKYVFELNKICILSLSVGLSFVSIFATLSAVLIPIIDGTKNNSDVDKRLYNSKLKKDLLKELLKYRSNTYKQLNEEEIKHLYDKLTNKLSIINTF